jgi:hypothetical protein
LKHESQTKRGEAFSGNVGIANANICVKDYGLKSIGFFGFGLPENVPY